MLRKNTTGSALAVGVTLLLLAVLPAAAANSIKIKVDDQPITSYDISQRTTLLRLFGLKGGSKQAQEELIEETIKFIEAAKQGLSVPEARVDAAIEQISQRAKMTPKQLEQALGQQGVKIETLRRRLKAQMTWQALVKRRTQMSGRSVKRSDIMDQVFSGETTTTTTEFVLQQVIFVVPSGSSGGLANQRRREAEAFRSRFPGCAQSVEMAKGLNGVVIKSLGRRSASQLGGKDGEEIKKTAEGQTTRPTKTDLGYEMIAVCSKKELNSNARAWDDAESELLLQQSEEIGKEYLAELKKKTLIEYR